jgi:hypothetical protein
VQFELIAECPETGARADGSRPPPALSTLRLHACPYPGTPVCTHATVKCVMQRDIEVELAVMIDNGCKRRARASGGLL